MTALAMRQTGIKPAAKIVLYWLADHHNGETGQCNPSINRLAKCCEMSRRSVENHLQTLQDAGLIKVSNKFREQGGQTSNIYTLCMIDTPTQNLRTPHAKSAQGDAQKLRTMNLGTSNLGIEQDGDLEIPAPSKQKRATSISEDWRLSERNIQDAKERQFTEKETNHEASQFRDYHLAKGSTFKNWDAAWRTWLGNARKFAANSATNQRNGKSRSHVIADAVYQAGLAGFD